jgi:Glycosyl hydrolases family 2, TIM barrel domain/Glycosyl hydrolases family 2, sugar binding domain/Glycosyl hydrolases family 2
MCHAFHLLSLVVAASAVGWPVGDVAGDAGAVSASVVALDGDDWRLATDPRNEGRAQEWWRAPRPDARSAHVPWIIQGTFPGFHGVAWYWRDFDAPASPHPAGRFLLRFGAVDYLADVWLNGVRVGGHEGGETPFEIDVTGAVRTGEAHPNRLAVRVLNPTNDPIDGVTLAQTARRCKVMPFSAGAAFDHGGITGPVELVASPEVRVGDLVIVAPAPGGSKTVQVRVEVAVVNAGRQARQGTLDLAVAAASSGPTIVASRTRRTFPPGESRFVVDLPLAQARLWEVNDPYLYRASAAVRVDGSASFDECSTRFGVRDFRFADGYFRLNGRRIYLRSTHTCNHFPIGQQFPRDPDLVRRDLLNLKAMGFNAVRFIWGGATPRQLDYCDEIGLLVYEESYASAPLADGPKMVERFDAGVAELIHRDRNHPSVVIWGLLNEAPDGPAFRRAVAMLPLVRGLDATRMVLLNSGRYDNVGRSAIGDVAGLKLWPHDVPSEPWVGLNATRDTVRALGITWPAGWLALHPGALGEYSTVRWTARAPGKVEVDAAFTGIADRATTDVHVLHDGKPLLDGWINLRDRPNQASFRGTVAVAAGDTLDCVVGYGNGSYGADSTALAFRVRSAGGHVDDAAVDFSATANPAGAWSYGRMVPGPRPGAASFARYPVDDPGSRIGSLSNPGSTVWEDIISDRHVYPRVPHTAEIVASLRTLEGGRQPVFLSEYGIGSAVDLWRAVRHFEQRGASGLEDAQFFNDKLNRYLADYERWHLSDIYPRPEDFFAESLRKMAGQRTLGLNAIRSNAHIVGHSLTGAIDHVMCGEGLTTLFRELKPGTVDALHDAWAPLRWCLFAEPAHVYRGQKVRLQAVLANEDTLAPGAYPARLQVVGPGATVVVDRSVKVVIPPRTGKGELPLATPCFDEEVTIDGPEGVYRLEATFLKGAAAAGGPAEFFVSDRTRMPAVDVEVLLWGDDPEVARWLSAHGIRHRPFDPKAQAQRTVILTGPTPPGGNRGDAFRALAGHVARGSTAIFLAPEVFREGERPERWVPLENKGSLVPITGWLYLKDEWAKAHPVFEGLPAGGLMDTTFYREIIPDLVFTGQDSPAEAVAGAIKASQDYSSGLMLAVDRFGAGRFVLNTLRIRENLGTHPAAERLLRNLLRFAGREARGPAAEPPADLAARLRAIGYEGW